MAEEPGLSETILHLDVDVLDTSVGNANEFAVDGGLGTQDLVECMDVIGITRKVKAMHIASLNPDCDEGQTIRKAAIKAIECVVRKVFLAI